MNTEAVEDFLRRSVHACEEVYGPDDPRLAAPLSALGSLCQERGRLAEAERIHLRVLAIVGIARSGERRSRTAGAVAGRLRRG